MTSKEGTQGTRGNATSAAAMASQRLEEASLNEEHILRQASASIPDGPADPAECKAMSLIIRPLMDVKITGSCGSAFGSVLSNKASNSTDLGSG